MCFWTLTPGAFEEAIERQVLLDAVGLCDQGNFSHRPGAGDESALNRGNGLFE